MSYIRDRLHEGPTWAAIVGFLFVALGELFPEHKEGLTKLGETAAVALLAILPNKFNQG